MLSLLSIALVLVQGAAPADLSADVRLNTPVTVELPIASMKEVVASLSKQSGVALRVQPELQEDLVSLYAKERPASEVLTMLAQHFGWQWVSSDSGYRLEQPKEASRKESQELQDAIVAAYRAAREEARERLKKAQSLDREAAQKELQALGEEMRQVGQSDPARSTEIMRRIAELSQLLDEETTLPDLLLANLSDRDFLELENIGKIVFSTNPTRLQRRLPNGVSQGIPAFLNSIADTLRAKYPEFDPRQITAIRFVVRRPTGGVFALAGLAESANVRIDVLGDGVVLHASSNAFAGLMGALERRQQEVPPTPVPQNLPEQLTRNWTPPASVKQLVLATRGEDMTSAGELFSDMLSGTVDPLQPIGRVLVDIGKEARVSLISDLYDADLAGLGLGQGNIAAETPAGMIHALAQAKDAEWSYDNGWVRIRSRNYPIKRAGTVPRSLLRPVLEERAKMGGLRFEVLASFLAKLTPLQLDSPVTAFAGMSMSGMMFGDGGPSRAAAAFCRFYDGLPFTLKESLKAGNPLTYGTLPPGSKTPLEQFLFLTEQPSVSLTTYADTASALQSLAMIVGGRGDSRSDSEFSQRFPNGVPPGTQIFLEVGQVPGVAARLQADGFTLPMVTSPEGVGMALGFMGQDGPDIQIAYKEAVLEQYRFRIALSPNEIYTVNAGGGLADPKVEYGPLDRLRPELQEQIRNAQRRAGQIGQGGGGGGGGGTQR